MVLKKDFLERPIEKREDSTNPEDVCDMGNMAKRDIRGVEAVQKRNPFLLIAELASFAARLGGSILARTLPNLARYSPRLAQLLKTPKNLFKLAPKSQGTGNAGGREAMRKAFQKLSDREIYKTCIKKGKP
jgi:hypothetical protein